MKLLKNLALLVCMQIPITFAMEGGAIQEIDAEPAASGVPGVNTDVFPSVGSLETGIEEAEERRVAVVLQYGRQSDGRSVGIVKLYAKCDILEGIKNIHKSTGELVELLKSEEPSTEKIMSAFAAITGPDILSFQPLLLQVVWDLYKTDPVLDIGNAIQTSDPRIEELGEEDL